jgi:hypothetical protein
MINRNTKDRWRYGLCALVATLGVVSLALVAASGADAMRCDVEFRSCATDGPPNDGSGGGGVAFNFVVGQKVGDSPSQMKTRGWECTDWIGSCGDDAMYYVNFKKCDSTYRYLAKCERNLIGNYWVCKVTAIEQWLFWC